MMRILMVGPIPPQPGGGPISRGQLAAAFAQAGHAVCVVAPIVADDLGPGDRYAAAHPQVRVARYPVPFYETLPHRPPPAEYLQAERDAIARPLDELAASFAPDLIVAGRETLARHVPDIADKHGWPAVLLARGNPTCHILEGNYPRDDAEVVVAGFRRFERILSVSDYMTNGLRRLGCLNVNTLPNAIDMTAFARRPPAERVRERLEIRAGSPVILVSGHINTRKRSLDVARSAVQVWRKRPDAVYVMAGIGALRDDVERICREAGVHGNLRLPGLLDYDQMPDVVNLADIVLIASEAEGMARTYLEAMACERALIASDIPPARELVRDGDNGLLFRLGDVEHLTQQTLTALDDAGLRERLGAEGRRTVAWRTLDAVTPQYIREFQLAIDAVRRRRSGGR
ncbi:MAG: glycosyltransferase family 4 protein [Bryobacteraceae bacterium]|nr:glycosyltransferase family 4 protein [Bryobacteraceae bacterium]